MPTDDTYTKVLLHCNGADTSTTFTDESGKVWTARGTAQMDEAQSKFGGASMLLDGNSDWIDTPDHADFVLGSASWTWDLWVRWNNTGGAGTYPPLIQQYQDGNNFFKICRDVDNNHLQCQQYESAANIWSFFIDWTPNTGQWYHVAVVRNVNTPLIFIDGSSIAVTEATTINGKTAANLAGLVYIGTSEPGVSAQYFNGWMDEIRFSPGIARWTANFTPWGTEYGLIGGAMMWD